MFCLVLVSMAYKGNSPTYRKTVFSRGTCNFLKSLLVPLVESEARANSRLPLAWRRPFPSSSILSHTFQWWREQCRSFRCWMCQQISSDMLWQWMSAGTNYWLITKPLTSALNLALLITRSTFSQYDQEHLQNLCSHNVILNTWVIQQL